MRALASRYARACVCGAWCVCVRCCTYSGTRERDGMCTSVSIGDRKRRTEKQKEKEECMHVSTG